MEANRGYIDATFDILQRMRRASGLFVKTSEVKVVLVPDQPLPQEFTDLDWIWEDNSNCIKLLGMFVGAKISPLLTNLVTINTLEN